MADIFISYKKEDAGRVVRIVEALRAEGFSVWWDHGIAPGSQWDQTIQEELKAAKAVIAIWSEQSVSAPWVKEEASVGKNRGILLPIRIDDVDPPLGFSLIQMGDLIGWNGDRADVHWRQVLGALQAIIRGETPQGLEAAPRRRRKPIAAIVAGALALAAAAVFGLWFATRGVDVTYTEASAPGAASTRSVSVSRQYETPPSGPNAQEQAAWEAAANEKTRAAFQSFLVAYPNGALAQRARDVLLTCRSDTREVWREGRAGQMIRGVNAEAQPTEAAACAAARRNAEETANRSCRAISSNEGYRNGRVTMVEGPCSCQQTPAGYHCSADPSYSCVWEMRSMETVEICG